MGEEASGAFAQYSSPERPVFIDRADGLAGLLKRRITRGSGGFFGGGATLQDALEGLVGGRAQGQHLFARRLDLLARVMAREVR